MTIIHPPTLMAWPDLRVGDTISHPVAPEGIVFEVVEVGTRLADGFNLPLTVRAVEVPDGMAPYTEVMFQPDTEMWQVHNRTA